jgi:hypothetical protein
LVTGNTEADFNQSIVTFNGIRETRDGFSDQDNTFGAIDLVYSLWVTHVNTIKEQYFFVELLQVLHSVNVPLAVSGGA